MIEESSLRMSSSAFVTAPKLYEETTWALVKFSFVSPSVKSPEIASRGAWAIA